MLAKQASQTSEPSAIKSQSKLRNEQSKQSYLSKKAKQSTQASKQA